MIALDDSNVITSERVLIRQPRLQGNEFSLHLRKEIQKILELKKSTKEPEEYPVDKWMMPPQPQCYLKCSDHDFL